MDTEKTRKPTYDKTAAKAQAEPLTHDQNVEIFKAVYSSLNDTNFGKTASGSSTFMRNIDVPTQDGKVISLSFCVNIRDPKDTKFRSVLKDLAAEL